MNTHEYKYNLPEELIAQSPEPHRSSSRLLVLDRKSDELKHAHFYDLPKFLRSGDLLIANDSRVIPARLFGRKRDTGAMIELLLLRPYAVAGQWEVLLRPAKRLAMGQQVVFGDGQLTATLIAHLPGDTRLVEFSASGTVFDALLDTLGQMPLPPYIKSKLEDPNRYQTVYAREKGSVAAPTAGLHFTPQLIQELEENGIQMHFITLHVGLGTFRPVQADRIEDHHMHEEWYRVPATVVDAIQAAKRSGRRVLCVGTTTVRALESAWRIRQQQTPSTEISGWTNIFIYPGFQFQVTDALITNFHLPESTLLMLVSALVGRERLLAAYEVAVQQKYRFYSFGDAMLIL
ncbi:tRNA preQ1(34) S-adenosylmethionine ribosyltransferase-isomerase QueA [Sulfoacidibacillus thermotolerans]|uniref:S-adenosylmethionine:tRNA ribosyltransferase-isomerase n=1 Tax=Sulfoacidibacillus thermotolerans TaxID=1765684 RepID=A0A2U3DB55_SULT2|nr:tRNA preQ1(34) S-adenosylmethionine ribosyltransferase-isomerase QueA [Sulfoacidibacillus thermotolerans]PWI58519.1 tRNA preQ1(34) S-adenosylmethionine ribosyltransferase-isomerase QueA [Sulfoacidibacillus thermotolerans]